jgi:hypothetical protein
MKKVYTCGIYGYNELIIIYLDGGGGGVNVDFHALMRVFCRYVTMSFMFIKVL